VNNAKKGLGVIIILAPVIFIGHFLEESAGFVSWFNEHVSRGITPGLFWNVNILALVVTLVVTIIELFEPSFISASLIVLWFSFLMLANAIFHITGGIVDQKYVPGLITAIVLYIPYYFFIVGRILKKGRLRVGWLIILAILGSALMLIHGYMILFLGDRLF
jgi:4-amino-4-deoxy-L-arabinose transferase-like glycosyltransferase